MSWIEILLICLTALAIARLIAEVRAMQRDVDKLVAGLTPKRWPEDKNGFGSKD